jgi:hypothetical protein
MMRICLLFHHRAKATNDRAQSAAEASFLVDDRHLLPAGSFHDLGEATHLKVTLLAAFTAFGVYLQDHCIVTSLAVKSFAGAARS